MKNKPELKCPYCGAEDNFIFEGTFATEAIYDESEDAFIFGQLEPYDEYVMVCATCGEEVYEEVILNKDEEEEK